MKFFYITYRRRPKCCPFPLWPPYAQKTQKSRVNIRSFLPKEKISGLSGRIMAFLMKRGSWLKYSRSAGMLQLSFLSQELINQQKESLETLFSYSPEGIIFTTPEYIIERGECGLLSDVLDMKGKNSLAGNLMMFFLPCKEIILT